MLEEGLVHNIGFAVSHAPGSEVYLEQVEQNFKLLKPLYGAIFNFNIQHDVLLDRLLERQNFNVLDRQSSRDQISARLKRSIASKQKHIEILKCNDIPVFIIDARKPAQQNAKDIKRILDNLQ